MKRLLALSIAALFVTSCGTVKKIPKPSLPKLGMPKLKMPKLPKFGGDKPGEPVAELPAVADVPVVEVQPDPAVVAEADKPARFRLPKVGLPKLPKIGLPKFGGGEKKPPVPEPVAAAIAESQDTGGFKMPSLKMPKLKMPRIPGFGRKKAEETPTWVVDDLDLPEDSGDVLDPTEGAIADAPDIPSEPAERIDFKPSAPEPIDSGVVEITSPEFGAYVGLTKWEAIALAREQSRPWRIGRQDGSRFPAPTGSNSSRVTFFIDNGRVVAASKG